ncbi:iron chelate uptake ABC transporter family permease subunit [Staphylococcus pseudintermedius]|uniref:Probable heme-iron transport system permease protein IsdF n=10 Tax=Staphylococcus pseudintermedius TaxID=283734 RepID=A0A2A4EID9_STAPS|nr:iron chelate uptake ABC transporter family permease subunit [Staphylococcus pseudintermedius]ADX75970.1 iron compound ABC transporter, permease protein [Staphylococcus pseudintermedius ED99]ANQ81193.1 iron-dicitrate transporter subunit FecD [Staphylococcus pseudintermedius]ANQ87727.1 iron-dicitrate transporter subunit FecD [Staphylococcus pseudintermedius]ASQ50006.1 iron-dicitrate transporter subunit FecD [Staphylococcus pseudintermedius]AYG56008.1 iron-dicitrate transporter subunit FecD [S
MNIHFGRRYSLIIGLLIVGAILSLSAGAVWISPIAVIKEVWSGDNFILSEFRVPRMLLGILVGAALAISGAVIQGVIRNPLASPDVIGITKGASLAAVIVIIVFPTAPLFVLPVASFIGALVISLILSLLISWQGIKGSQLALIGMAIGAVAMALVQYLLIRNPMEANIALVWLTGSLFGRSMDHVLTILPWLIVAIPVIFLYARKLDILHLGEEVATALGTHVQRTKMILLFTSVMLAGAAISVVGGLSFLGLIAPHIARSLVGHQHRHIVAMSGLVGALLMVIADGLARIIAPPIDIPVGVLIAIIGAPYFLYVLRKM